MEYEIGKVKTFWIQTPNSIIKDIRYCNQWPIKPLLLCIRRIGADKGFWYVRDASNLAVFNNIGIVIIYKGVVKRINIRKGC